MTPEQTWLSKRYILYRLLTNLWFVSAVWLYFYRLFINDQQVGLLDGMTFAIGLIAEIPSGVLADKFGRDKLVRTGQILVGTGIITQGFSSGFLPIFLGQAILMIGASFVSGADEALFFDKLNFKRGSTNWRKLVTRGSQAALVGSLVATIIGGWLHNINPRIPFILTGLFFIFAIALIWPIKDTRTLTSRQKLCPELVEYFKDITNGFKQFRLPELWLYLPIIVTIQGLFYATGWGLLRIVLLDRFQFTAFQGSLVVAASSIATVAILFIMNKTAERLSEKRVLTFISLSAIFSLLISVFPIAQLGFIVILILYSGEYILHPFMSEILNKHAPEQQRATVLSVASFMRMLPYVLLAPIIGYLNSIHRLEYFLLGWAVLMAAAVLLYLLLKKRDSLIKLTDTEIVIDKTAE